VDTRTEQPAEETVEDSPAVDVGVNMEGFEITESSALELDHGLAAEGNDAENIDATQTETRDATAAEERWAELMEAKKKAAYIE